uniref:Galectin n=1 Tax=Erpetoichthys calabaricus TaxID=27687 RepID=A0A8C4RBL9_ERPCA
NNDGIKTFQIGSLAIAFVTTVFWNVTSKPFPLFHINFKVSYSGDIVFHLNPRFTEFVVVRNSFLGGCWGREERELEFNPFQLGQYFDVSFWSVYVNGQHLCSFNHRFQEFQQVDTLEVEGDVQLSYVQF